MNSKELSMQPWGTPVFMIMVPEEFVSMFTDCGLSVRKSSSGLHSGILIPVS